MKSSEQLGDTGVTAGAEQTAVVPPQSGLPPCAPFTGCRWRANLGPQVALLVLILADQLSKWWVQANLALYEVREIIPGLFNLVHYTNTGAAFGLLAGEDAAWRKLFFVGVALVALVLLTLLYRHVRYQSRLYRYALALIASGAVGNLIDRVRFGEVTDFLDFYWSSYHWPAFNVADSAISVGVLLFLLASWLQPAEPQVDRVV